MSMKSELLLAAFTPSVMSHADLEAIFVRREPLATRLMESIQSSVTTRAKRHELLVGPRGIGKTHLVSLIYHRIWSDADLSTRTRIAWLREEMWEVTSFLDLLVSVLKALAAEYSGDKLETSIADLGALPTGDAERRAEQLLLEFLGETTLLILMENLEDVFESIEEIGQRQLRAFLQNYANSLILATTPSLFFGVSDHGAPFYGFFNVTHLDELTLDDAVLLLTKIAELRNDQALAAFVATVAGKERLEAVQHLAGGHPRIWIFFASIVTEETLDALVPAFLAMLDDLTPYYQSRMKELPPQQRKIVSYLCQRRGSVPVKEIAEACRLTQQVAGAQLHSLRDKAFVRSESVGRESWYELNEPLMRLVLEIKESRGKPLRLIVDFLRRWYSRRERQARYAHVPAEARITRLYAEAALDLRTFCDYEPVATRSLPGPDEFDKLLVASKYQDVLPIIEEAIEVAGRSVTAEHWRQHGQCMFHLGNYPQALSSYERAIEIDPCSARSHFGRGCTLSNVGRAEEAMPCFDTAIRLEPNDAPTHFRRGCLFDELGRYEEALAAYGRALDIEPNDAHLHFHRGLALGRLSQYEEALTAFDRALEIEPNNAPAHINRGVALGRLDRHDEALAAFNRAVEIEPNDARAHFACGLALGRLDRHDEALAAFNRAVEIEPNDARAQLNRSLALRRLGRYEEALAAYDRALDIEPNDTHAQFNRGWLLGELGRYEEALVAFDRGVEIEPNDAPAHFKRGWLLDELGRYEEALAAYGRALDIEPNDAHVHFHYGLALRRLDRHGEALAAFDRVIEIEPNDAPAQFNRGSLLGKLGRYEEALAAFDRGVEIEPNDAHAHFHRGLALGELGRHEEALAAYGRAIKIEPNDAHAHFNRGVMLDNLARYHEAVASYDRAIELDPTDQDAHFNRGESLRMLGRYREALTSLDRALEIQPDNESARSERSVTLQILELQRDALPTLQTALEAEVVEGMDPSQIVEVYCDQLIAAGLAPPALTERLTALTELYARYQALPRLGEGVTESIPTLFEPEISTTTAAAWNDSWQAIGKGHEELEIPLRLLDAAVRWRLKPDRRILLALPEEERRVLKELLPKPDEPAVKTTG